MRGENCKSKTFQASPSGTPPHAWGKRFLALAANHNGRYTPTCVGKTLESSVVFVIKSVHPHMRGENDSHSHICAFYNRYTPTCVGKTAGHLDRLKDETVHPHMRGENIPFLSGLPRGSGTPPHAWGKLCTPHSSRNKLWYTPTCVGKTMEDLRTLEQVNRYTPTCVGKTLLRSNISPKSSVHPHMRGENLDRDNTCSDAHGTPPHAWGKLTRKHITARR